MRQQWLSPVGPRVPVVKAYPIVMPPDTESDEEHKATKAYSETPGEHTHTHTADAHTHTKSKAGEHKCMQKGEQTHVSRPDMYSTHMNTQTDR